ncbi:DNA phosphorothioation system sulfurtransferase DndC [Archaeoglobus sp.]
MTNEKVERALSILDYYYSRDDRTWVVTYSGGKDSTAVLQLVFEFLWDKLEKLGKIDKEVYVVSYDVLVENPFIKERIYETKEKFESKARELGIPLKFEILRPRIENTFWVKIIGYGYPPPSIRFRWCTDKLKILPFKKFLEKLNRDVYVITGRRHSESSMRKHLMVRNSLNDVSLEKASYSGARLINPIEDWSTAEVWLYLLNQDNFWVEDNKKLYDLYKNASLEDNCPDTVPSLDGVPWGNSRFGCWTCTVVSVDKSMLGLINNVSDDLRPLYEFREKLLKYRNPEYRESRRRNGSDGLGPIKKEYRKKIMKELLSLSKEIGKELILPEEINEIERVWKLEGMPSYILEEIYYGTLSERGSIMKVEDDLLEEICKETGVSSKIIRQLLALEKDFQSKKRRRGIYGEIKEILRRGLNDTE